MSAPRLRIDVLTLFPSLFDGFLSQSILNRAIGKRLVDIVRWDIRNWAEGKHKQVDDRPFGGGPGMVLMAPPVVAASEAVRAAAEPAGRLIALSPQGRRFDQQWAAELAGEPRLILLCGRY
jgi:tRNA (guanine37-N1)-methyltransferase